MRTTWMARTRRLLFVLVVLLVLTLPLASSLLTRARIERSGVDVSAPVLRAATDSGRYFVAFRLPKDLDPEQRALSAEVDHAAYERAVATKHISVRVLADQIDARRVEGQVENAAPWVFTAVADALVLVLGLWWVRGGRRRPPLRMLAQADLVAADADMLGALTREENDIYEAAGTVASADERAVVVDIGNREVLVVLGEYRNTVAVGSPVRARGPLVG